MHLCVVAQPKYHWPVATAPQLVANFGELRSNHYHMGLDCRTERRENLRVLAVESGFVSRIKIESWGFGRSLYIDHPNGVTSVYAHLNDFNPEIEKWVTEQQYAQQSWAVDLYPDPALFPVKRGEFIAFSGNTGGSLGPHVHFELRETSSEKVINPLVHGMHPHINDKVAPDILRLAVYDRCVSTYEQSPRIIALKRTGNTYRPEGTITVATDKVSFGFTAWDKYTGSTNQNGIYEAVLYHNGKEQTRFTMDSIHYHDTRYLNAHIDYRTRANNGPYLQHLSRLPGHHHSIYSGGDGIIELPDTSPQQVRITVSDPAGNISVIELSIRSASRLTSPKPQEELQMFHPNMINVFENNNVRFYLPENALYDSFRFVYKTMAHAHGTIHRVHQHTVPVHTWYTLFLKGDHLTDTGRVMMKYTHGTKTDYRKAVWKDGWYAADWRGFGDFQLVHDTIPPVISAVTKTSRQLIFTITDDTEELKNFRATLNGKWLRFSNDKGKRFVYTFDEYCPKGENELIISVEDLSGNKAERKISFTR